VLLHELQQEQQNIASILLQPFLLAWSNICYDYSPKNFPSARLSLQTERMVAKSRCPRLIW
jgi:hypothetical protein